MKINFYISSAGVSGDPDKLLVAMTSNGNRYCRSFNHNSNFSLWRAKKKLIKRIKLLESVKID